MAGVLSLDTWPIGGILRVKEELVHERVILAPALPFEVRGQSCWIIGRAAEDGRSALGGGV